VAATLQPPTTEALSASGQRLDAEHPWPGLWPFTEENEAFFNGRDAEASELARLVHREPLTLLYGQSGLGKSSLLMAGLFPRMRREDYLPVYIRLDHSAGSQLFGEQVLHSLEAECARQSIEAPRRPRDSGLWEYLHLSDGKFWSPKNRLVMPLFVIDQFEELFTLGNERRAKQERMLTELAAFADNRPPDTLLARLDEDRSLLSVYNLETQRYKLVLSMREDYLAFLDELKRKMRLNMHNALRLTPMNGQQALDAVKITGGRLITDTAADSVVRFLAKGPSEADEGQRELREGDVDPALLSMVCFELNTKRIANQQPQITEDLLEQRKPKEILCGFYERSFDGLLDVAPRLRVFVEERLLTESGFRNSAAIDDARKMPGVTVSGINELVQRRLLRSDVRSRVQRVELTHDVLADVVKESRDKRRLEEQQEASKRELEAREQAALRVAEEERRRTEEQRQRAEDERRRASEALGYARRSRALAAAMLVIALVAGGMFFYASSARNDALRERQNAINQRQNAIASEQRAVANARIADSARSKSDSMARRDSAMVQQLTKALAQRDTAQTNLEIKRLEALAESEISKRYAQMSGQAVTRRVAQAAELQAVMNTVILGADSIMENARRVRRDAVDQLSSIRQSLCSQIEQLQPSDSTAKMLERIVQRIPPELINREDAGASSAATVRGGQGCARSGVRGK
jgi:hypothetical protein